MAGFKYTTEVPFKKPVARKKRQRTHPHVRRYGLTEGEYRAMLYAQGHTCALCKKHDAVRGAGKRRALAVDHDHVTGKVRGLLCMSCNLTLGVLEKRGWTWFLQAHAYLMQHGTEEVLKEVASPPDKSMYRANKRLAYMFEAMQRTSQLERL